MNIVIRNGRVMAGEPAVELCCDVKIENGIITEVGNNISADGAEVIDAAGKIVMPGLVDIHSHFIPGENAGFYMAVASGVTTAMDPIVGNGDAAKAKCEENPLGITCSYMYMLAPGRSLSGINPDKDEIAKAIDDAVAQGCYGVKVLGAHFPFTPEAIALMIKIAAEKKVPLMLHAGSTIHRDNLDGMRAAVEFSEKNPFILAHISTYCDGTILGYQEAEAVEAIKMLNNNPHIVSESTLSPMSCMGTKMDANDIPESMCLVDILTSLGYPGTFLGMRQAITERKLLVSGPVGDGRRFDFVDMEAGLKRFEERHGHVTIGYSKHSMVKNAICVAGKRDNGQFTINTITTDGGLVPRNIILENGLPFVNAGILSMSEFVAKTSRAGANILGLTNKGVIATGFDADIVIVDTLVNKANTVIANGKVIYKQGEFFSASNRYHGIADVKDGLFWL